MNRLYIDGICSVDINDVFGDFDRVYDIFGEKEKKEIEILSYGKSQRTSYYCLKLVVYEVDDFFVFVMKDFIEDFTCFLLE